MTRIVRRLSANVGKYGGGESVTTREMRRELIYVAYFRDFSVLLISNDKNIMTLFKEIVAPVS
jgi:hypothetical protein